VFVGAVWDMEEDVGGGGRAIQGGEVELVMEVVGGAFWMFGNGLGIFKLVGVYAVVKR
jgi:hypothetical protein